MKLAPAKLRVMAVVMLAGVLPWLITLSARSIFGTAPHVHEPFHESLELIGACVAFGVALLLLLRVRHEAGSSHHVWVIAALLAMGSVDGVHGVIQFGAEWSWLRHTATLIGGLLFGLVWLPLPQIALRRKLSFALAVAAASFGASLTICLHPEWLPAPFLPGGYSVSVKAANLAGGLGFLFAASYFFRRYLRQPQAEDLVFASHTLLFGSASLLFGFSHLWTGVWWVWHGLRLLAYAILIVAAYKLVGALYKESACHLQELGERVQERTAELERRNAQLAAEIAERQQAEKALRQSEQHLRLAEEMAHFGTFEWDIENDIAIWSPEMAALYGLPPGGFSGSFEAWRAGIHPEDVAKAERAVREALETGVFEAEWRVLWPSGATRWIEGRALLIRDDSGKPVRMIGSNYDITERKRVEEKIRHQNAVFEGINRIFREALGCDTEEEIGRVCLGVAEEVTDSKLSLLAEIKPETGLLHDIAITNPAWEVCQIGKQPSHGTTVSAGFKIHGLYGRVVCDGKSFFTNNPAEHPDRIGTPKGHPPLTAFLGVPLVQNGKTIGLLAVANREGGYRDEDRAALESLAGPTVQVLMRRRAEATSRRLNAELEQRVAEQTGEIRKSYLALKRAHAQLTARAGQLRALAGELTLTEQRERLRLARILHDHLQQLLVGAKLRAAILGRKAEPLVKRAADEIENLLDEAIRESRSLTAELSPPILVEGGLGPGLEWLARWMADKHGLAVELSMKDCVLEPADHVKILLFESVRELLFNAVKHAHVHVATVNLRQIGEELRVTVSDAGPGFEPNAVKRAGEAGGGFGLFSIRERLGLIGGEIQIDSAPGRGSRFVLIAPLNQVEETRAQQVKRTEPVLPGLPPVEVPAIRLGTRIRVLLADDHTVMRDGLARLLEAEPDIAVVGQASDGQMAVELARELRPDVVLMDLSMPKLSGVEATRFITSEIPEVKVIGLSMFDEAERAQTMFAAGAAGYLTKSSPSNSILSAIRSCMKPAKASETEGRKTGRRKPEQARRLVTPSNRSTTGGQG